MGDKMYQILLVNRSNGFNFIIPDKYVYNALAEAEEVIHKREQDFEKAGEVFTYKGVIKSLSDIRALYHFQSGEGEYYNDGYIYELKVK